MSKRGGTKRDLFLTIAHLQEKLTKLMDQNTSLLTACKLAIIQPHDKNCWTNQKNNPGPCTCHIADIDKAIKKVEGK